MRVPGTAVFLTNTPGRVPHALLHNLKHNKVLHERVVLLTINTREIPVVATADRVRIESLGANFEQIKAYFGFTESQDVPELLEECARCGHPFDLMDTSFFVSRETLIPSVSQGWRSGASGSSYRCRRTRPKRASIFNVPTNRVVELGAQVEL